MLLLLLLGLIVDLPTPLIGPGGNEMGGRVNSLSNFPIADSIAEPNAFVVAHQDDWQLFMGDVAAKMLRSGAPVKFVYLTAGDDGRDSLYWRTREGAALRSTRVAGRITAEGSDSSECTQVVVRMHSIRKCMAGTSESYFLRLPDGRRNGGGFTRYDHQSLRRLRAKRIPTISAVDGSAAYQGWEDFASTVDDILGSQSDRRVLVHTTDPSVAINPHDHFDHRMAGLLILELRKRSSLDVRYYLGYALATRAANRSNDQAREKTAIFLAYDQEMTRVDKSWSAYREHPAFYSDCMLRTYARTPSGR
jgi:LmbE family N-acetylglucosaminyl deacetylase